VPISATTTSYGAAAYAELRRVVHAIKGDDPLRRVTLVVPSERVGVAARRALARGGEGQPPGIAALSVLTLRRVAEILAADQLLAQGRRPLTGPALASAVREVLAEQPGEFQRVAHHIGTVRALADAHRTLRLLDERVISGLAEAAEPIVAETVRVHRAVRDRLAAATYDEPALLGKATTSVSRQDFGPLVVFLPQDLDAPELSLLSALSTAQDVHLVVGLTGRSRTDAGPRSCAAHLGVALPDAECHEAKADTVLHASDPDDEVRAVVRRAVTALRGRPGHRIAVLHGSTDPYARLLHEHLGKAGVTFFGRGVRPAVESAYGSTVLRLLALAEGDFRRRDVLTMIAGGPVQAFGRPAPSSAWERVSRDAGIVAGDDWSRLVDFARQQREEAAAERAEAEPREWLAARRERNATSADELGEFVNLLRATFAAISAARTWRNLVASARELLDGVLVPDDALHPEDSSAARRVASTLEAAAGMSGTPSERALREVLELELDAVLDRVGTIGIGVHVGPVAEGIGDDVDEVFVVGAAEGLLPARSADDPLLPERVRELTDGALPTVAERSARQHRHVLAALAAAPAGSRTMSFPRGDLRRGGERQPSRWLLESLRALSGRSGLQPSQWREIEKHLVASTSYTGSVTTTGEPAHAQEWRQRAAVEETLDEEADVALRRARALRRGRQSSEFTEYDGDLGGEDLPVPTDAEGLSPTALEDWVKCPHAYFLRRLLGVAPVEEPDEVVQISALERGNVLHAVWERLVSGALDEGWAPGPGQAWPESARERLAVLAEEEFAKAEARGITGFPLLWEQDRRVLLRDLEEWLVKDDERRARLDEAVPIGAEHAFGNGAAPPVCLDLGDGRTLRLRGRIDRLDRRRDGGLVVTDYKTGKAEPYRGKVTPEEPTDHGQRLQLPVYALAAREAFGEAATPVRVEYWFTSLRGGFERVGFDASDDVLDTTRGVLRTVVDGISGGWFLARPPDDTGNRAYACPWCDVDGLGTAVAKLAWPGKSVAAGDVRVLFYGEVEDS
jgi:ATP-dependent helicase/nuclease subunit B